MRDNISHAVGGYANACTMGSYTTIGGGYANQALGNYATIGGGYTNIDSADYGFIGGGKENVIKLTALYSAIPGGTANKIHDPYCLAFGNGVEIDDPIDHGYITVFYNDANPGKVGINIPPTTIPTAALEVNGTVKITEFLYLKPMPEPAVAPPGPGWIYYDDDLDKVRVWTGLDWEDLN